MSKTSNFRTGSVFQTPTNRVEYFNSIESLNLWLIEEQTRPYWDDIWTCEILQLDGQGNEAPYIG